MIQTFKSNNIIFYLIAVFLQIQVSLGIWEILTQEFVNKNILMEEVLSWDIVKPIEKNLLSQCSNFSIVGGPNAFNQNTTMERGYDSLPEHYKISLQFSLFLIDFSNNTKLQVLIDDIVVNEIQAPNTEKYPLCGSNNQFDSLTRVQFSLPHFGEEFNIKFAIISFDENPLNCSWGIRDVQISLLTCYLNCFPVSSEFIQEQFDERAVLDWNSNKGFGADDKPWTSYCGLSILGGFDIFGENTQIQKQFELPKDHYMVLVSAVFYFIDSWSPTDQLYIQVDDQEIYTSQGQSGPWKYTQKDSFCGSTVEEKAVTLLFGHSQKMLDIKIFDKLNQKKTNQASWGLRDLKIYSVQCIKQCSFQVQEFQKPRFSSKEIRKWYFQNTQTEVQRSSNCGGKVIFGGLNVFTTDKIQKIFENLTEHSLLFVFAKVYYFDIWDRSDLALQIDDIRVQNLFQSDQGNSNLCGNEAQDEVRNVGFLIPHFSSKAILQFISNLQEIVNNESWGLRELSISVLQPYQSKLIVKDFSDESAQSKKTFSDQSFNYWQIFRPANDSKFIYKCNDRYLFGGANIFNRSTKIRRYIDEIPVHSKLYITFQLYIIDAQDNSETFVVSLDEEKIFFINRQQMYNGRLDLCGVGEQRDQIYFVQLEVFSTKRYINIDIYDQMNKQLNDSWGIRDFQVYIMDATKQEKQFLSDKQEQLKQNRYLYQQVQDEEELQKQLQTAKEASEKIDQQELKKLKGSKQMTIDMQISQKDNNNRDYIKQKQSFQLKKNTKNDANLQLKQTIQGQEPYNQNCILIFSECNYKGQSGKICAQGEQYTVHYNSQLSEIRSIKVPENLQLIISSVSDNKQYELNQSENCVNSDTYKIINEAWKDYNQLDLQHNKNKLKPQA